MNWIKRLFGGSRTDMYAPVDVINSITLYSSKAVSGCGTTKETIVIDPSRVIAHELEVEESGYWKVDICLDNFYEVHFVMRFVVGTEDEWIAHQVWGFLDQVLKGHVPDVPDGLDTRAYYQTRRELDVVFHDVYLSNVSGLVLRFIQP